MARDSLPLPRIRILGAGILFLLLLSRAAAAQTLTPGLQGEYWGPSVAFFGTCFYVVRATVGPTTTGNSNEVSVSSLQPPPKRTTPVGGGDNNLCGMGTAVPDGRPTLLLCGPATLLVLVRRR